MDMVTSPPETALLRDARAHGLRVVDGLAMLARQAAAQQRFWIPSAAALSERDVESELRRIVLEDSARAPRAEAVRGG